jgi:hypothetical protein
MWGITWLALHRGETMAETANLEEVEQELVVEEVETPEVSEEETPNPEEQVIEPWMEAEGEQASDDVPVGTLIRAKQKLKGRLSDSKKEIADLRAKIETIEKNAFVKPTSELGPRPKAEDYDTDEEYYKSLDEWEDKRFEAREIAKKQTEAQKQAVKALEKAVDSHYERAGKLVEESGISSEVFQEADKSVRSAVESIRPKQGDLIVDQLISIMGDGSEKVLYYLGRNKAALGQLQGLLAEDPSGMKAAIYIGQQKEKLTNPHKKRSSAPAPAGNANGDVPLNNKGTAEKRKYDEAHKKGNIQKAYSIKKAAKAAGVDVSGW